jgi:hypothetical protein
MSALTVEARMGYAFDGGPATRCQRQLKSDPVAAVEK